MGVEFWESGDARLRGDELSWGGVSVLERTVPCRMTTIISRAGASFTGTLIIVTGFGGSLMMPFRKSRL